MKRISMFDAGKRKPVLNNSEMVNVGSSVIKAASGLSNRISSIYTKGHQPKMDIMFWRRLYLPRLPNPIIQKTHFHKSSLNRNSSPVIGCEHCFLYCNNTLLGASIPTEHVLSCILFHVICQLFKERRTVSGAKDPHAHCVILIISLKNRTDIQFR